ncbi:wee1-like protein kinase isoform X2, partial [Fagus crenata]
MSSNSNLSNGIDTLQPDLQHSKLDRFAEVANTVADATGEVIRKEDLSFFPGLIGGDGLSRYHTVFHEIEQIGTGNFSLVFKVSKRIGGCLYAVKHSKRLLHLDTERRTALMEVQTLAALGSHENIVGYYSSWFENEQLFIQMELCDHSLSIRRTLQLFTEGEVLQALHQ